MLDANKDFEDLNLSENEDSIKAALEYLRFKDPANANREYAVNLLKRMQKVAETIANKSELSFEKFIEKYNKSPEKN